MKRLTGLILFGLSASALAQDHADIDKSQIIGNRELPKVLYIVPWKKPVPGELSAHPMESVLNEALAPLDKDVFQRQLKYEAVPASKEVEHAQAPADRKNVTTTGTTK